ncbi:MAG TPA: hypothetical protein VK809_08580 [Bacteroidia bacterium]|jgi:hypothetical protein|nr:hypothetical protein [Bacteroidia bacterium]
MKRLLSLTITVLSFSCTALYGQFGAQLSLVAPTGYYSYVLKPGVSFEIVGKLGESDGYYSFGGSIGYFRLTATQDTFKTYAVGGLSGNLYPGYSVLHSFEQLSFGITNDLKLMPTKKLTPVLGCDLNFSGIQISEDDYAESVEMSSDNGQNYWLVSIVPRMGVQYKINDKFFLSAFFGRSLSFLGTANAQQYDKTSICFIYYPE